LLAPAPSLASEPRIVIYDYNLLLRMPADVPTLAESFTSDQLLRSVGALLPARKPAKLQ
jgi:hypothetical protein